MWSKNIFCLATEQIKKIILFWDTSKLCNIVLKRLQELTTHKEFSKNWYLYLTLLNNTVKINISPIT